MKIKCTDSTQNTKSSKNNELGYYLGRLGKYKRLTAPLLIAALIFIVGGVASVAALSGDEIFTRVQMQADSILEGDLIFIFRITDRHADGTTSTKLFAGLSQRVAREGESFLLFVKEPAENFGMIHLLLHRDGEARMWLYLPLLGITTEIIVEEAITGAGGLFMIGVQPIIIEEYSAQRIGEEILFIAEEKRPVYLLALTARPDARVDFPSVQMWVDKERFLPLRIENYTAAGELALQVEILAWEEFEEAFAPTKISIRNLLAGSERTITIYERWRPIEPFPAQLFDPKKLADFDPAIYGLID
ncbi:outer membrane lipoprotein-sorting protein [Candidatus Acetothermia bacterium]|nr:outer membrane lipoprotein-sorting protein [Candidatus Acetothermia bacterium]